LFTWVVRENDVVEPRAIEVGPSTKDLTVVTSGLSDGERVVTGGQYKLKRGATVTISTPQTAASGNSS
jgi:multidrug efflux system membrane fusion protein